jgi:7-carboxy-7-deazaguanine synthase
MTYSVKEIFYTLQGEGGRSGRPSVFCRFSGCNLWTGLEKDRSDAICQFCDTDFWGTDGIGGGKFETPEMLADAICKEWPGGDLNDGFPYVVFTGGEPLLQLDKPLIDAMHERNFEVSIETNGTIIAPKGVDWICVSPKANADLELISGNELKLIHPQKGAEPEKYVNLDFEYFYLQPMDGVNKEKAKENTASVLKYCMDHPQWRMSLQTHKILDIP